VTDGLTDWFGMMAAVVVAVLAVVQSYLVPLVMGILACLLVFGGEMMHDPEGSWRVSELEINSSGYNGWVRHTLHSALPWYCRASDRQHAAMSDAAIAKWIGMAIMAVAMGMMAIGDGNRFCADGDDGDDGADGDDLTGDQIRHVQCGRR
jgi:hypothetical protein